MVGLLHPSVALIVRVFPRLSRTSFAVYVNFWNHHLLSARTWVIRLIIFSMASVRSLGIHRPTALSTVIAEGILPSDASEESYSWQTLYHKDAEGNDFEDELLTTTSCVVWSRAGVVRRIFRLEVENEPVVQAVLTNFSSSWKNITEPSAKPHEVNKRESKAAGQYYPHGSLSGPPETGPDQPSHSSDTRPAPDHRSNARAGTIKDRDRALVVVLKTQAHIYFLSGPSHIIHLPFEVAAIFPLPQGILLQRKLDEKLVVQPTPLLPSAPFNSFSAPDPRQASSPPSSQPLQDIGTSEPIDEVTRSISGLLKNVLAQARSNDDSALPVTYCLTDPLREIGTVTENQLSSRIHRRSRNPSTSSLKTLDHGERLLYISSSDELLGSRHGTRASEPFMLALTRNHGTSMDTLWRTEYTASTFLGKHQRRSSSESNRRKSRRQSSFGPGTATGTTTPGIRQSVGVRDSFGAAKESMTERSFVQDDPDLASQLDPAFENPAAPAKTSRRISSLLARSELSSSQDKTKFTDIVIGSTSGSAVRRGHSFGHYGTRSSFTNASGTVHSTRKGRGTSQPEVGRDDRLAPPIDSMAEDSASEDDLTSSGDFESKPTKRGLRNEMAFFKVYSMPSTGTFRRSPGQVRADVNGQPHVFVLQTSLSVDPKPQQIIALCIMDRALRRLSVLQLRCDNSKSRRTGNARHYEVPDAYAIQTIEVTTGDGIIDACKISDGKKSRILVLEETVDGFGAMTLQAPWSTLMKIRLPSNLLLHNPYQLHQIRNNPRKTEGGLKRVLSQGPEALTALRHGAGCTQVDIVDQTGTEHRIEIILEASTMLVKKLIGICEYVLPCQDAEREPVSRCWWDVLAWLREKGEDVLDLEWTAFVVVLFSMFIGSEDQHLAQSTIRQKRRKTGLLRSGSGTEIDLESWNKMMVSEGNACGSFPNWLQSPAWAWAIEQGVFPPSHEARQSRSSRNSRSSGSNLDAAAAIHPKRTFLVDCARWARDFVKSTPGAIAFDGGGCMAMLCTKSAEVRGRALSAILVGIHLFREELKLDVLAAEQLRTLTPVLAQLGGWLGWESWGSKETSFYMLESADMDGWIFDESTRVKNGPAQVLEPPSIFEHVEKVDMGSADALFMTLLDLSPVPRYSDRDLITNAPILKVITPRTALLLKLLEVRNKNGMDSIVDITASGLSIAMLETFPEGIAAPLRSAISSCQVNPVTTWPRSVLALLDRDDIAMLEQQDLAYQPPIQTSGSVSHEATRDVHSICNSTLDTDAMGGTDGSAEVDRQSITRMIFKDDQRFAEAVKLVHPLKPTVARCAPEPDWSDTDLLEAQQDLVKIIAVRTLAVSPGRGMIFYSARVPLITERFPVHGFTLSCIMKPGNLTVTADKVLYTEEKVSWAFFHAGVEAGLTISRGAGGIDTSWILYNKPAELNNRHAGFLLALGLNGHLKNIAKWVAFKYLTTKHTMTSIGLLLGLAASYLGTMDTLITRLLSVHVTRMLPPGAAELNLSPLTQTTGIMAIGLLYCNTQHRRMSEIMLSEIENIEQDENASPMDNLRDEGYRLAAGFSLGYINLGQGKILMGLHDMHIVERLLVLAVGTRKVEIVHILDKATAAATIAIALIFMKTQDERLAKKIDIPETPYQFEYVRPDIFLLRTVAKHLIMWDNISATTAWMRKQLPAIYQSRVKLSTIRALTTEDMPLFNIIAGLCLSIGLRFAGSAKQDVRNLLGHYLDQFIRICRLPALNYEGKVTRITGRNCQDAVALAAATVMAGTGDLFIFRRLRSLHGRTDPDTPYGSHLAAHLAIGVLFLAGGTHTLSTSNLAIASLLCAFYPLFPTSVLDNKAHLQAFRHFWVLAAEPRCLVVRDADSQHPLPSPLIITRRDGKELSATAPCLLPELDTIAQITTDNPEYWRVTLDFAANPAHLPAFKRHQSIYVRRRGAYDAHGSVFSATMQALNDTQAARQASRQVFEWLFDLPSLKGFDRAERAMVLPAEGNITLRRGLRGTAVDDRLVLEKASVDSGYAERLWNLRVLFAWAEKVRRRGGKEGWLGREVIGRLKAEVGFVGRELDGV